MITKKVASAILMSKLNELQKININRSRENQVKFLKYFTFYVGCFSCLNCKTHPGSGLQYVCFIIYLLLLVLLQSRIIFHLFGCVKIQLKECIHKSTYLEVWPLNSSFKIPFILFIY